MNQELLIDPGLLLIKGDNSFPLQPRNLKDRRLREEYALQGGNAAALVFQEVL